MKIGFLAPINGIKEYGTIYHAIVNFLAKKGHEVVHPMNFNLSMVNTWTTKERIAFFEDYYKRVNKSDLIIAECSYSCASIGYEIANAIQKGKEVIVLKTKDTDKIMKNFNPLYTKRNVYVFEYNSYNLQEVLKEALSINHNLSSNKNRILITPEMVAKHNEIAKRKSLYTRKPVKKYHI
jgi:nucleoside 2-deoxyribosyltransferase